MMKKLSLFINGVKCKLACIAVCLSASLSTTHAEISFSGMGSGILTITVSEDEQGGGIFNNHSELVNGVYQLKSTEISTEDTAIKVVGGGKVSTDDIQTLMGCSWVKSLDLCGVYTDKIVAGWTNQTFQNKTSSGVDTNKTLETLGFPMLSGNDNEIQQYLLTAATGVRNVIIPKGITKIGDFAFKNIFLTSAILPDGLKTIGKEAFFGCNLTEISLPNTLERIENSAFIYPAKGMNANGSPIKANGLKTIVFPASLNYIGTAAFVGNSTVTDVWFLGTAPETAGDAFDDSAYMGHNSGGDIPWNIPDIVNRSHYFDQHGYVPALLHINPDLSDDEKAKFTDLTRKYSCPDTYLGDQLMWPTHEEIGKASELANIKRLWDGETETKYPQYMGLHKFVFVAFDANLESSKDWTFTLESDLWWTIMVPFNMTKAQVKEVFGENTEVCKFSDVERVVSDQKKQIKLSFKDEQCQNNKADDYQTIEAFRAYMIRPSGEATFKLENYVTEPEVRIPTNIESKSNELVYTFIGNSRGGTWNESRGMQSVAMPQYSYFLGAEKGTNAHKLFFQTKTNGKWNQWTGIVQVMDAQGHNKGSEDYEEFFSSSTSNAKSVVSCFGSFDSSVTVIDGVVIEAGADKGKQGVYTISGQKVSDNASLDGLTKGVYVVNGKKFVVK